MGYKVIVMRNENFHFQNEEDLTLENSLSQGEKGFIGLIDAKSQDRVIINKVEIIEIVTEKEFLERVPQKKREDHATQSLTIEETQKLLKTRQSSNQCKYNCINGWREISATTEKAQAIMGRCSHAY